MAMIVMRGARAGGGGGGGGEAGGARTLSSVDLLAPPSSFLEQKARPISPEIKALFFRTLHARTVQ